MQYFSSSLHCAFYKIDEKDRTKFCVARLTADNFFSWAYNVETILKEERLWNSVEAFSTCEASRELESTTSPKTKQGCKENSTTYVTIASLNKSEAQKRDLFFANNLMVIDAICKGAMHKVQLPMESWNLLKIMFHVVLKTRIEETLSQLQSIQLQQENKLDELSHCVLQVVCEFGWEPSLRVRIGGDSDLCTIQRFRRYS